MESVCLHPNKKLNLYFTDEEHEPQSFFYGVLL